MHAIVEDLLFGKNILQDTKIPMAIRVSSVLFVTDLSAAGKFNHHKDIGR